MTLDDLIATFSLPRPTKIKIDVDTNELKIIRGADKTLDSCKEVYIEMCMDFDEHIEIFSIMEGKGFSVIKKQPEIREFLPNSYNVLFGREG